MELIVAEAINRLKHTPSVRNLGLSVQGLDPNTIILIGNVPTYYAKQMAQEAVIHVLPNTLVLKNHLTVIGKEAFHDEEVFTYVINAQKGCPMNNFGKQSELKFIDPTKIKLNDDKISNSIFRNVRTTLKKEEMASNRESIRTLGLLKPLIIRPIIDDEGFTYQLVCGSRRLRNILRLRQDADAIIKEGRLFTKEELCYRPETAEWLPATEVYKTIKVFIRECDDDTAIRINIAENLEHSKVPEIDLMEFCQELVDLKEGNKPRYTREEVGTLCNRSESWVSLTLDLNRLPERVKNMMYEDRVTRTAALAFLQTEKDKLNDVIEAGENLIKQEKMAEASIAEQELNLAQIDLADAENDIHIHDIMQNTILRQMAEKRANTHRKRVSAASEKKEAALTAINHPVFTADIINKANLMVPGAKKGAPKAMAPRDIKNLYQRFKESPNEEEPLIYNVVNSLLEAILGHKTCESIISIIKEEKERILIPIVEEEANV